MLLHEAVQDELSERAWGQWGTSPSSQMGLFSLHGDFQALLGGHVGQLRQCFGHAFIYHYPFFLVQLQIWKCIMLLDFWSFSKIAEVFQFCFFFFLGPSPWLFQYLYFSVSYCQLSSRMHGLRQWRRLRANMTWMSVLLAFPLLESWLIWCLQGIRHWSLQTK